MPEVSVTVYGIFSSRDGEVRYIGQTKGRVAVRLGQHLMMMRDRPKAPLFQWLNAEIEAGYSLGVTKLIERATWNVDEQLTIDRYVASGADLLNYSKEQMSALRSEIGLKKWEDPEYRKKVIATRKRIAKDPERLAASVARLRLAHSDPEIKEKRRQRMVEVVNSPEYKEKMQAVMTAKWQEPEYREAMKVALADSRNDEWRRKISDAMKKRTMTEQHKQNIAEGQKRAWAEKKRSDDASG